jgi:hypothetical protein
MRHDHALRAAVEHRSPQCASWLGTRTGSVMPMPTAAAQIVDVVSIEPAIDTSAAPHPF